jgi:antitoxin CptB
MDKDILIKKLLYRSNYRGCKETDFLVGNFAKANLDKVDDLNLYAEFLDERDGDIYDWIMEKTKSPLKYKHLVQNIKNFHNINSYSQ